MWEIGTQKIAALLLSIGNKNLLKQDYISSTNTVSSADKESNKNSSIWFLKFLYKERIYFEQLVKEYV